MALSQNELMQLTTLSSKLVHTIVCVYSYSMLKFLLESRYITSITCNIKYVD